MKTFGEQLREARKGKVLTQETLARRADLTEKTVRRMESDEHTPTLLTLLKLTRELRATFEFEEGGKLLVVHTKGNARE